MAVDLLPLSTALNTWRCRVSDAFGDAIYEAWMSGFNPDKVEQDRVEEFERELGDPWLAAEAEVNVLRREHEIRRELNALEEEVQGE